MFNKICVQLIVPIYVDKIIESFQIFAEPFFSFVMGGVPVPTLLQYSTMLLVTKTRSTYRLNNLQDKVCSKFSVFILIRVFYWFYLYYDKRKSD